MPPLLPPPRPTARCSPLAGERTNLRAGHPSAATAHLYLHLSVPQLLGSYLRAYMRFTACSPALYLLALSAAAGGPAAAADSSLESLAADVQATTAR